MGPVGGSINASALEAIVNDRPNATGPRKPRMGALTRRNTRRLALCGRPRRRYVAIASPTSADKGSSVRWPLLPRHSAVPRSNQCCRVRETPLHRNASPGVRARARWRNRDTPPECPGRCWPATDGPGPPGSPGVSMTSTSWLRWAPQRPNPTLFCRDSARTAGRNATHWSRAWLASGANAPPLYKSRDVTGAQV